MSLLWNSALAQIIDQKLFTPCALYTVHVVQLAQSTDVWHSLVC